MSKESGNSVVKKVTEIMGKLEDIPKRGHNDHYNYDYVREEDVTDIIREKLANHNLALFQNVVDAHEEKMGETKKGNDRIKTTLWVEYTFVDADTGESHTCKMPCAGIDTEDKGIYKAITGGNKYFLLKTFQISSGGDDPELDQHKASPKQNKSKTKQKKDKGNELAQEDGTITDAQQSFIFDLFSDRYDLGTETAAEVIGAYKQKGVEHLSMEEASKLITFLKEKQNKAQKMIDDYKGDTD